MEEPTYQQPHIKRWIIWGLAVFFYFYEYFLRVAPGMMIPELMEAFSLNAVQIGSISSVYLYTYALLQIPVGLMMDRFGPRNLLTFASVICGGGALLFGSAQNLWMAVIGSFLMGAGSAFAFLGMVYISSHLFERAKIAFLIGLGNSLGMVGGIFGQGPLGLMIEAIGWRTSIHILGIIGLVTALLMFILISRKKSEAEKRDSEERVGTQVFKNLKLVIKNGTSWVNGIGAFLIYATTGSFAGLWGVPFLQKTLDISKSAAGFTLSMIFLGWVFGGPIVGFVSDRFQNRKAILWASSLITGFIILPILYINQLSIPLVCILLFLIGVFSSAENLTYCVAMEVNEKKAKGTASAFTNFILFLGGSIIPPLVGEFLDLGWTGQVINGVREYSLANYRIALATFPVTLFLGFLFFVFMKVRKKDEPS